MLGKYLWHYIKEAGSTAAPFVCTPFISLMAALVLQSVIIGEGLLAFSIYKILSQDCGFTVGVAAFVTALLFLGQAALVVYYVNSYFKRNAFVRVVGKEYDTVKNALRAFTHGFNSR